MLFTFSQRIRVPKFHEWSVTEIQHEYFLKYMDITPTGYESKRTFFKSMMMTHFFNVLVLLSLLKCIVDSRQQTNSSIRKQMKSKSNKGKRSRHWWNRNCTTGLPQPTTRQSSETTQLEPTPIVSI